MLKQILASDGTDNPGLAISLMLVAVWMLSLQDALVKLISTDATLWQFQLLRAAVNLCIVLTLARVVMPEQSLRPKRVSMVGLRAVAHVLALICFFGGAPLLTLAEMAAGLYTFPLFVVLLGWLVNRESVGVRRVAAVIAGFLGTLLILQPASDAFKAVSVLPVCAGFFFGCYVIVTRRYCRQESPLVLVVGSNLVIAACAVIGWSLVAALPLSDTQRAGYPFLLMTEWNLSIAFLSIVVGCALLNSSSNLFLSKAYQSAESSFLAPFDYTYLILATFWGYLLWRDRPDYVTLAGMALIAAAGIFVALRERQLQRRMVSNRE